MKLCVTFTLLGFLGFVFGLKFDYLEIMMGSGAFLTAGIFGLMSLLIEEEA